MALSGQNYCFRCGTALEKENAEASECICGTKVYSKGRFCANCGRPREEALKQLESAILEEKQFGHEFCTFKSIELQDGFFYCEFENGDRASVSTDLLCKLMPKYLQNAVWSNAQLDEAKCIIQMPAESGIVEIPWDTIRRLTHTEFAAYCAEQAAEQSRYIGYRLKELRIKKGLTQKFVAESAGIEPANLSRIENGQLNVSASTLFKLLSAMFARIQDLGF